MKVEIIFCYHKNQSKIVRNLPDNNLQLILDKYRIWFVFQNSDSTQHSLNIISSFADSYDIKKLKNCYFKVEFKTHITCN